MHRFRSFAFLVLVQLMSIVGCTRTVFQLELRPNGDQIERSLSVWEENRTDGSRVSTLSDGETDRIGKLYASSRFDPKRNNRIFEGSFDHEMPPDVGGWGRYLRMSSPLGDTYIYTERFRGQDDLSAALSSRRKAADEFVDHIANWLKHALRDSSSSETVVRWVETDLRRDMQNVVLYCWTSPPSDAENRDTARRQDLLVHLMQYGVSHDYIRTDEIPRWTRAILNEDASLVCGLARDVILRKAGIPAEESASEVMQKLVNPDNVLASLREYLRQTSEYQERYAAWKNAKANHEEKEPKPEDILTEKAIAALMPGFLSGDVVVELKLHLKPEPFFTNGQWVKEESVVRWRHSLDSSPLPSIAYAAWSEPNEAYQHEHFGSVVLTDSSLGHYVNWYRALTPTEASQWDAMIAKLNPADDLVSQLNEFEFAKEPKLAKPARSLLVPAISRHRQ